MKKSGDLLDRVRFRKYEPFLKVVSMLDHKSFGVSKGYIRLNLPNDLGEKCFDQTHAVRQGDEGWVD